MLFVDGILRVGGCLGLPAEPCLRGFPGFLGNRVVGVGVGRVIGGELPSPSSLESSFVGGLWGRVLAETWVTRGVIWEMGFVVVGRVAITEDGEEESTRSRRAG